MAVAKNKIDWEALEREYRADVMSNVALAKKYSCAESSIRKRAKKYGWTKDLTKKVRERASAKLARVSVRTSNAQEDEKAIEEAAQVTVNVVLGHRQDLKQGRDICRLMLEELQDGTKHRVLIDEIVEQAADEEGWSDKARAAAQRAISLPSRSGVLRDLAQAMHKFQAMERTAFNIDENGQRADPLAELISAISDTSRGIDGYGDS